MLAASAVLLALTAQPAPTPTEMGRSVAPLVDSVKESVVTIRSIKFIPRALRSDPFHEFLRERFGMDAQPRAREETQQGLGSGFIIDQRGTILTNNHVVAGADEVQVLTSDGRVLPAKVEGSDPGTDVAVVRLTKPPGGLKIARLGDSERLRVGDYVLAIGNPLGLGQTVTMGIVSAKNRTVDGLVDFQDFIQTDAAINQGNSGGPLFNFAGEVIGINSAIVNPARAMNVGFAIPINLAKNIADQLLKSGRVGRGYLGIVSEALTPELARRLGVELQGGAVINGVERGGPADKAGLRPNDIVVEAAGRRIESGQALTNLIKSRRPGETIEVVVLRQARRIGAQVTLSENINLKGEDILGMTLQRLSPEESARLGLPANSGLRVVQVKPRGLVSGSLQEGDVVVMIAAPTRSPATVESLRAFESRVRRGGHGQLIIVREGEPFALNF
jgi:serine protease Do